MAFRRLAFAHPIALRSPTTAWRVCRAAVEPPPTPTRRQGTVDLVESGAPAPIVKRMRSQLRPLFDRVVIKELDPDRVRRSGLVVPPGTDEPPPQHGIVLAVGPGLDWWDHVGV